MSRSCSLGRWNSCAMVPGSTSTRRSATGGTPRRCSRPSPAPACWLPTATRPPSPARALAGAIGFAARAGALATTRDLQRIVDRAWGGRPHPRKRARVFQALRMWVNQEAEELAAILDWLPAAMRAGGVVVTLAYHSGEDRIIKQSVRGRP